MGGRSIKRGDSARGDEAIKRTLGGKSFAKSWRKALTHADLRNAGDSVGFTPLDGERRAISRL